MDVLEGAFTKLYRTTEHFNAIYKTVERTLGAKGHTFSAKIDRQTHEVVIFVRPKPPRSKRLHVPLMLSVVIGELLHDLRSALDNMIYDLVIQDGGTPDDYTEFPIFRSRRKYNSVQRGGGLFKLHGVGPKGLAFVEGLQPFDDRHSAGKPHPLLVLHELSRVDKHRLVHVCGMALKHGKVFVTDDHGHITRATIHTDARIDGRTELVRIAVRANTGYDDVKMQFDHAFDVVFYDAPLVQQESVLKTIHSLQKEVSRIVSAAHETLF